MLEVHGWGAVADELRQLSFQNAWDEMPRLITEEMMDVFCVAGSCRDIGGKLVNRYGDHATRITIPGEGISDESIAGLIRELRKSAAA